MLNEGVVLEVNSKESIVISPDKGIVIIKRTEDMSVGKLIFFSDDQIYIVKSRLVKILSFGSAAAAIVLIAFLLFFRTSYQDQIYAYIDIDINQSIELAINKDNKVLSVEAINEDANALAKELDIEKKSLDKAIINIIEESISDGYISTQKSDILFSAALAKKSEESGRSGEMEKILSICKDTALKTTNDKAEVKTLYSTYEIKELANTASTTIGRYYIYNELSASGSDVSLESIKSMPVKDLFKHIDKILIEQQVNASIPSNHHTTSKVGVTSQKATPSSPTPSVTYTKGPTPTVFINTHATVTKSTAITNTNTSTNTNAKVSKPTIEPKSSVKNTGSWKLKVGENANASQSFTDKKVNITINNKGSNPWDVAFTHPIDTLEIGARYRVSFKVNALKNTKIYAKIGDSADPFNEYWNNNYAPFNIDANSPIIISQEFTPTKKTDYEEIAFHMGGSLAETVPNTISIDDVIITKLSGSDTKTILNYNFEN